MYPIHRSRRRRQVLLRRLRALSALAALVLGVVLLMPVIQRVIAHFGLPLQYAGIIRRQAADKHLDPALIAAVIYAETRFEPRTSPAGAEGLMQIEPQTAQFLARSSGGHSFHLSELGSPSVNIAYGTYYLRYLLNLYAGSKLLALAAYNGGETNVDHWIQFARAQHRPFTINDIPIAQTRAYVGEVMSKQRSYRARYAHQLGYG